ncbi:flagellar export protein FliJ [Halopseudomonas yangmingensis]|uniref:Flagellar FliJ protein n=1 Tax=Halopseudomonas yangmingensis TaxID=1720063 RepID=A0A1I4N9N9_9GAMM|nr:flagellar export protein FliJ [Halopseudomonas yangmingensis]SFM11953.1 flagellar FliJ protein [Halopseudomonas yangmingensis]
MSEERARRLQPVLDMALEEERQAAAKLGQCQREMEQAQARLVDLEAYTGEYHQGWQQRGAGGVDREWLLNYQRFLARMQTAIDQQQQALEWHRQAADKARQLWREKYQRVEALRTLIQRYLDEARLRADRQEQKLLDELSQRAQSLRDNQN